MRQKETKRSPLDAIAGKGKAVPGAPDLSYSLGGVAEVGGAEVERVLDSVEMDDQVAAMRGPYAGARRIGRFVRHGCAGYRGRRAGRCARCAGLRHPA